MAMRILAFLFGIALLLTGASQASAIEVYIGGGAWEIVGGHYENRWVKIEVEPGRYETRHIPAVTETRVDKDGKSYEVIVVPERTEQVYIPPKTEDHLVAVWVDDDGGYCYYHGSILYSWGRHTHFSRTNYFHYHGSGGWHHRRDGGHHGGHHHKGGHHH